MAYPEYLWILLSHDGRCVATPPLIKLCKRKDNRPAQRLCSQSDCDSVLSSRYAGDGQSFATTFVESFDPRHGMKFIFNSMAAPSGPMRYVNTIEDTTFSQ